MNIIGICGSPRPNGNSAQMLEAALEGARAAGAVTKRIDLYGLDIKGCCACFGCKLLGSEGFGRCNLQDDLTPVLEQVLAADGVIVAAPIFFEDVSACTRAFWERMWFPAQQYAKNFASAYKKRVKVGLIYTMNMPTADSYKELIGKQKFLCSMLIGKTETLCAVDTVQFPDYDKYSSAMFDGPAKLARRETEFPKECAKAFELGKRMAEG